VPERRTIAGGGVVWFEPNWLEREVADEYFKALRVCVPWQQGHISFFGRSVAEPRLTAWYGDADYTYSGRTLHKTPWPELLMHLREKASRAADVQFNSALLNLYRNGRDSMGLHCDAEPELGKNPVIASVSLGVTRKFLLRPKKQIKTEPGLEFELTHGSLLVMGGTCQHFWKHAVPKQLDVEAERINLTFRRIISTEGPRSRGGASRLDEKG
jgi:alkylated DNA repair dioxygenase AlkB